MLVGYIPYACIITLILAIRVVFLQETHFRTHHVPKLSNMHFPEVFHVTNNDSKSILISRDAPFRVSDQLSDPEGRFLFVRGTYGTVPPH